MRFEPTEERGLLSLSLHRYFTDRYGSAERERAASSTLGFDLKHWNALNELGVTAALFPQAQGGLGGSCFDIATVFERIGGALAVEPFLGTLMAGVAMDGEIAATLISGEELFVFGHHEPSSRHDPEIISARADRLGQHWRLNGTKGIIRQLDAADHVVVTALSAAGPSLFLVDPAAEGVRLRTYAMIDGGRGGDLELCDAPARLIGTAGSAASAIARALALGTIALCWEAIGAMDHLRAATLDYMRTRRQFGRAIGTFQALQHRMATVAIEIEQARSAAINAAAAVDACSPGSERAISAAKYTIGRVATLVAEEAVQIHGGIAMTWELPASRYAKRLIQIGQEHGDEDHHLARFISLDNAA